MDTQTALQRIIEDFRQSLLSMDRVRAMDILARHSADANPARSVEEVVIPSLEWIGERFEEGELSLSQYYMSGLVCEEAVDEVLLKVISAGGDAPSGARIAMAVLEDHHALGKKIVYLTLRSSGFEVIDFGVGIPLDEIVSRTLAEDIDILMVSVLMLPAAMRLRELRRKLDDSGDAGRAVKLLVGGAPFRFDAGLWREVGADAVAGNASQTIGVLSGMIEELQD